MNQKTSSITSIILFPLLLILIFLGACKKKDKNEGAQKKGKSYVAIYDSTYSGSITYPDGSYYPNGKSYPLSYTDSVLFDTLGANKYLIIRKDTFYRNWITPIYQSFTCKGISRSFPLDLGSNGGNEVRLYINHDTLSIHSIWHARWDPEEFSVSGILK